MILIVDDNASMRGTIRMVIGKAAGSVLECSNGAEAIEMCRTHHPEWVTMDIRMRGMDGITSTREIKSAFPDTRIIIVTYYDDADFRKDAKEAGAFGFVPKSDLSLINVIIDDAGT
jgi:DNA-binding NarL/FixJ family response regulator